jgi:serine/threonine protein phosphatase PrpC
LEFLAKKGYNSSRQISPFVSMPNGYTNPRRRPALSEKELEQADSSKPVLYFRYAGLTNTGLIRDHNEDAYKLPLEADAGTLASKGHLYVLADGMGGHHKGEVASKVTIETVNSEYYTIVTPFEAGDPAEAITEALSSAIGKANSQVLDATEGGGTTVVAAVLYEDSLVAMNVGDSRAYLLRNNELRQLSKDHSLVRRLVEVGKITAEEALTHPRRNVLYQALGQGSEVDIYISSETLQDGDIVILCSDGLWGEVAEPEIKTVLQNAATPLAAAKQLIDSANASGGLDNITAIIIQVSSQSPFTASPDLDDTHPSLPVSSS